MVKLIIAMALVTYLIRMLPFVLFRKKIESKFLKSVLYYVPYSVLGAMTIPGIFYSTSNIISAAAGLAAALIFAFKGKSLLTVAIAACAGALLAEIALKFI